MRVEGGGFTLAEGEGSEVPDAFFVTATNVLNKKSGILIWSPNATSVPFGGGTLCVGAPTKRTVKP